MIFRIKEFFLLIFLILLQSCSGGKIGDFLESSFDNLNDTKEFEEGQKIFSENKKANIEKKREINKKNDEEIKTKKQKKISENKKTNIAKKRENAKKNDKEIKTKKKTTVLENNKNVNLEKKSQKIKNVYKEDKEIKKRKGELQSYKIIFILKEVDPKDPIKELSTILRNSEVNFEIEKIERYLESNKKI